MTSLLAGFSSVRDRAGRAIGVVPEDMREGLNPFNDTLILTNLPAGHAHPNSRNHLNVLLSDAIVALAGGPGTLHEIGLARHYGRALAADCYWSKIAAVPDGGRTGLQPYTAPCVCHVRAVQHAMPLTPTPRHTPCL